MKLWDKLTAGARAADEDAARRGLTIERGRLGSRVYRDPRFDGLAECQACSGSGVLAEARHELACDAVPCTRCLGTGVIRVVDLAAARELARAGGRR